MSPEPAAIELSVFGATDIGRVRKNNEDNFAVADLTTGEVKLPPDGARFQLGKLGLLLLVADGMGGESSGEVASEICASVVPGRLRQNLSSLESVDEPAFVHALRDALDHANGMILQKARESPFYAGMGTTATAAGIFGGHLFVGQVGDSRAYLQRGARLVQLTRDQSFLNYLADIGASVPTDFESDSRRNILTQAVGTSPWLDVKVTRVELRRGDRILVCSDGLYSMVRAPELKALLDQPGSLADRCQALVSAANANGGTDNITAILAEVNGNGLAEATGEAKPEEYNPPDPAPQR
jgi:serine/threonine protein phosphatase PrpC